MTPGQTLKKITMLLRSGDTAHIDQGIELVRSLHDPSLVRSLLKGAGVHKRGYLYKSEGVPEVVLPPALKPAQGADGVGSFYAFLRLLATWDLPVTQALKKKLVGLSWAGANYPLDVSALPELRSLSVSYPRKPLDLSRIQGLTHLTRLSLEGGIDVTSALTSSTVQSLSLSDLGHHAFGLGAFPAMRRLHMNEIPALRDLRFLRQSAGLEELLVEYCEALDSLEGIEALRGLRKLHIDRGAFTSLEPLRGLDALEELQVLGTPIEDLSVIASLPNLVHLDLGDTHVRSLAALRDHPRLASVQVDACARLESLEGLPPNAVCVRTDGEPYEALRWGGMRSLRSLDGLHADLLALQAFELWSCPSLTSIEALGGASELTEVVLREAHALPSLRGLERCAKLQSVTLDDARALTDLSALAGLSRLERLSLQGATSLTDLSPLAALPSLKVIDLRGASSLTDLTPLVGLPRLKTVALHKTAVPRRAVPRGLAKVASFAKQLPHKRLTA